MLRRIDWTTPANILEKIIRYEAVHAIEGWDDLRRRLEPPDRRLYAFFHPALGDEPLIFVEVALTDAIPAAIAPLLATGSRRTCAGGGDDRRVLFDLQRPTRPCARELRQFPDQAGRRGVEARIAAPDQFCHAVAGAGLRRAGWRARREDEKSQAISLVGAARAGADWKNRTGRPRRRRARRCSAPWFRSPPIISCTRAPLRAALSIPSRAFTWATGRGWSASIRSAIFPDALRQSHGLMVNYLYDLDHIEDNHETYANRTRLSHRPPSASWRAPSRANNPPKPPATGSTEP